MDFRTFKKNCKHHAYSYAEDNRYEIVDTCHMAECKPQGFSWGDCDEEHCPFFKDDRREK